MTSCSSNFHNIYVGTETGLLKGVSLQNEAWSNLTSVESLDRQREITAMCWNSDQENEICIGSRMQNIDVYNLAQKRIVDTYSLSLGKGIFKGISKSGSNIVTCVDTGIVNVWNMSREKQLELYCGEDLWCMRQNVDSHNEIATGGKENDLKVWDLEHTKQPIFKAKNVKDDWLDLRVPVWIRDIGFVGGRKIVTGTGHHQVRMYDMTSSQRRPVMDMEFDEYPITSLSVLPSNNQVIVGNTHGNMALVDLRKGAMVHCYKGFAGGIKCIQCHSSKPFVASCGVDRFLRVHDIETKQMLHKFYLKSRLNCLLFAKEWQSYHETNESEFVDSQKSMPVGNDDDEEEAIWANMKTVKTKRLKRTSVSQSQEESDTVSKHKLQKKVDRDSDKVVKRKRKKKIQSSEDMSKVITRQKKKQKKNIKKTDCA